MKWIFAKNDGGRESGFHDAGVETFKGNFHRSLARELIQNSLDARQDPNKPVLVKFELLNLKRSELPDMDSLKATFARCAEYWKKTDKKGSEFFQEAEKLASAEVITALKVGDYNTKGVLGSDTERDKNWFNLIRCAGSSSKSGGEGGSFGIGKNAPFAASLMRTVFYSTYNADREHVFQGVATLVSHNSPDGGTHQPTGFLGLERGASVREKNQIPKKFLRSEFGTDIIVLGFPVEDVWKTELVYAILDNFWPAVEFGDLEAVVGDVEIKKSNLAELLQSYSGHDDFTAHSYYRAFKNPTNPFHQDLPNLRGVDLYLFAGEADLQKRVAMVRKTGMKIFEKHFRSILPFCGVFICRNEQGNRLLREMEPPRHDVWDADHPEKGANKKVEAEYISFIRECVRKLAPSDESKVIAVPGLSRFLPDDDDTPEEQFDGENEESSMESPHRRPLPEKIEGKKIDPKKRPMQPDQTKPDEGDQQTETDGTDGTGGGPGKKKNDSDGGKPRKDGERGGPTPGAEGGAGAKPAISIRYRAYCRDASSGVYVVTVSPSSDTISKDANLLVWAIGDDQKVPVDVKVARLTTGASLAVTPAGVIGPVKLSRQPLKLEVVLRKPVRMAMEVTAHEA